MSGSPAETGAKLGGRPASTSAHKLAEVAQKLFLEQGFSETSVEDIAAAAGVSSRTFFRYFATKADVLWVETPAELERMKAGLAAAPPGQTWRDALCCAIPASYVHPPEQRVWALQRAELVLREPSVLGPMSAHSAEWRCAVADFVASRLGCEPDELGPLAVSASALSANLAAQAYWVAHPTEELPALIARMLQLMLPRLEDVWNLVARSRR